MNLEIANRLVALRKENHLSQEALAEKLGISRQAVSKWERAEASPDTDNLIALAKLYHVSLDELLRIHEEDERDSADGGGDKDKVPESGRGTEIAVSDQMPMQLESIGSDISENQTKYGYHNEAENETSGRTGQKEDEVHIGLHGIHVKERDGNEVHVGWDGIHVHDENNEVHIDKHGIYVNGEEAEGHLFGHFGRNVEFPLWLLAIVIHIIIGVCFGLWWTGWLIYLAVPVISTFIRSVRCRNPYLFAYPVLVVLIYLYIGLIHGIWHPTWVIYLTIPLYYSFLGYIRGRRDDDDGDDEEENKV